MYQLEGIALAALKQRLADGAEFYEAISGVSSDYAIDRDRIIELYANDTEGLE